MWYSLESVLARGNVGVTAHFHLDCGGGYNISHFFHQDPFGGECPGFQMFFAASGAAGSIRLVMQQAPSLFAFSLLQISIHFVFLMGVGRRIFGLQPRGKSVVHSW
jgi:hypothetical protein